MAIAGLRGAACSISWPPILSTVSFTLPLPPTCGVSASRSHVHWPKVPALTTNADTVEDNLRRVAAILADDGPAAAYESMLAGGSNQTKFMGPAYFTKFLFFTGYRDAGVELRPLILDRRVATALRERGVFGLKAGNADWPSELYRRYLTYCHEQNPTDPAAVEADLFNEGRAPA